MTDEPDHLYDAIYSYVRYNDQPSPGLISKLMSALETPGSAEWIIGPVVGTPLYRGLAYVQEKQMRKILKTTDSLPDQGSIDFTGVITPKGEKKVMSFSKSIDAVRYKFLASTRTSYWVIFTARAEDNPGIFLDLTRFYEMSNFGRDMAAEEEVLALGPVKLQHIEWGKLI